MGSSAKVRFPIILLVVCLATIRGPPRRGRVYELIVLCYEGTLTSKEV